MPRLSPFHSRTYALCRSYAWKEWAGYVAVSNYDRHSEREYFAIRGTAGLLDVTPLYKYEIKGPDAAAFLAMMWTRDITRLPVGRVVYGCMLDEEGYLLDDGTVACLDESHFRVTSSEPWLAWYQSHSRGFDVRIEEVTHHLAALALQGPRSLEILQRVVADDLSSLRFFGLCETSFADRPLVVTRTGYTGDLGFELWTAKQFALPLWDALTEAGADFGLQPVGLDALDVARIEAGFVLQGVDYISSRSCLLDSRKSTPFDAGLGWTVKLEREGFIGRDALKAKQDAGGQWGLVGLEISWPAIEELHDEYGIPPHLAPVACRSAVPIYDRYGLQVGQATSSTWSPTLKRSIALAQVKRDWAKVGTELRIEYTVEFERRELPVTVVPRPFFDPPRKTHTAAATDSQSPGSSAGGES
jgi:aminomethyltransferase